MTKQSPTPDEIEEDKLSRLKIDLEHDIYVPMEGKRVGKIIGKFYLEGRK